MPSFSLSITFGGLCLLATDRTQPNSHRLHALLLKRSLGTTPNVHPDDEHLPRLVVDKAYTNPGSTSEMAEVTCWDLDNQVLNLAFGSTPIDLTIPGETAALQKVAPVGLLDPSYVTGNSNHVARSRLTMFNGAAGAHGCGAQYTSNTPAGASPSGRFTNWQEWVMQGVTTVDAKGNDCVTLHFGSLERGNPPLPDIPLYPVNDRIKIYVINVTQAEMPIPHIDVQTVGKVRADDFDSYFMVFPGIPVPKDAAPVFDASTFVGDSPLKYLRKGCNGAGAFQMKAAVVPAPPSPGQILGATCFTSPQCIHATIEVG
jgi:hypothetical protein